MIIGKRDKHEIVTKQILYYAFVAFARSSTFHKHSHAWSTANKMESPLIMRYGRNVDTRYYAVVIFARSSTFYIHSHAWYTANKMESRPIMLDGRNVDAGTGVVRTAQHVAPGHLIRRTPLQQRWVLWLYNLPPHTARNSNKRRSELFRFGRILYFLLG